MKYLILILLILNVSCSGPSKPDKMLEDFVIKASRGQLDQEKYNSYTIGSLKKKTESLSDEDFETYLSSMQVKSMSVKILKQNCQEKTCAITYLTTFETGEKGKNRAKSVVKKIALLEKVESVWKIANIKNELTKIEGIDNIDVK